MGRFCAMAMGVLLSAAAAPVFAAWPLNGTPVFTGPGAQSGALSASDGQGGAIVVWNDGASMFSQQLSAAGSLQWAAGGVAIAPQFSWEYPVIADGSGGAIVAMVTGSYHINAQKIDAAGNLPWGPAGITVCNDAAGQHQVAITSDGAGGAIIAWYDLRNSHTYTQRITAAGAAAWAANGLEVCNHVGGQSVPAMVSDTAGGAIVAWRDLRNGNRDIFAQRINSLGAGQWAADGVALCTAVGDQGGNLIVIAPDGAGGAIVGWEDRRNSLSSPDLNPDIYARRVSAAGTPLWNTDGVAVCTVNGPQKFPAMAADGAGGAFVVWDDNRNGPEDDVYAQHLDHNGVADFGTGDPICVAVGMQISAQVVPAAGGAVIMWTDARRRVEGNFDLFAQRIDNTGVPQWTVDGLPVSVAPGDQYMWSAVTDGAGGAIAFWEDRRNDDSDIYAQRIGNQMTPVVAHVPHVQLTQNVPNPFNPTTVISFTVSHRTHATLSVFNVSGSLVRLLVDRELEPGLHHAVWDGRDDQGRPMSSGVYFYRLRAGEFVDSRKMILLK